MVFIGENYDIKYTMDREFRCGYVAVRDVGRDSSLCMENILQHSTNLSRISKTYYRIRIFGDTVGG